MNLKKIKKVYFLCSQIPKGFVSTYKEISNYSGIDPRSVGRALKLNLEVNPFSKVPCHRVISVNFFIGGYCGE
jgi:methylated-DNA-[protein]-cysteine S-methyltransferase